jgi:hypothetical protein
MKICPKKAFDLVNNQMNAHASQDRESYMAKRSYPFTRPVPGSYKKFPNVLQGDTDTTGNESTDNHVDDKNERIEELMAKLDKQQAMLDKLVTPDGAGALTSAMAGSMEASPQDAMMYALKSLMNSTDEE